MPVAGLPAAAEASLSSLLASQELSSWKVVGEPGASTVVVLRFCIRGGRPLLEARDVRGTFRRKPPSMVKRDRQRAEQHRRNREQNVFLDQNTAVETHRALKPDDSTSTAPTHERAENVVTSDLPRGLFGATADATDRPCSSPDKQQPGAAIAPSPTTATQDEVTVEFCKELFNQMSKRLSDKFDEMSADFTGAREELRTTHRVTSHQIPPASSPAAMSKSRRRLHPKSDEETSDIEGEVFFPAPDRLPPPTTHRVGADDGVHPPRGPSVERRKKQRSARSARPGWPT